MIDKAPLEGTILEDAVKEVICGILGYICISISYFAFPGLDYRHVLLLVGSLLLMLRNSR